HDQFSPASLKVGTEITVKRKNLFAQQLAHLFIRDGLAVFYYSGLSQQRRHHREEHQLVLRYSIQPQGDAGGRASHVFKGGSNEGHATRKLRNLKVELIVKGERRVFQKLHGRSLLGLSLKLSGGSFVFRLEAVQH